jgi:hypothetical protein
MLGWFQERGENSWRGHWRGNLRNTAADLGDEVGTTDLTDPAEMSGKTLDPTRIEQMERIKGILWMDPIT